MLVSWMWFGLSVVACCSLASPVGQMLGVIDYPDGGRKNHARPTPLVGGIALMAPLLMVALAEAVSQYRPPGIFISLLICGLGFVSLGWYDDRHHVRPGTRLVISAGLFGALILLYPELLLTEIDLGPQFTPLALWIFALPFTIVCLVGLQNAVNMVDGMNGLLIGLAAFWTGCMMIYAPAHLVMYLQFLMLGLIIVLPFNLSGSLFLGDAGSYSLGATIGVLMIYTWHEADGALPMLTVVLWLLVPVIDCLRVMSIRLWSERSPLLADRNHLHHRLGRHWRWPTCLFVYLTLVALPGLAAAAKPLDLTLPMIVLALVAYSSLLWLTRDRPIPTPRGSPELV